MSRTRQFFWTAVGTVAVLVLGSALLFAAPVATGLVEPGLTSIRIHDKQEDFHLYLPLPDAVVGAGLTAASAAGAFANIEPLPPEARQWMPAIRAAAEALAEVPDAVLVQVESREEQVSITKRGSRLVIRVRSPEADVDVEVSTRVVARVLDVVERAGRI